MQAARRLQAGLNNVRISEVEDEDKSSQYGDRRVHVEKAYSNSAKVSQLALAVALARRGSYDLC